MTGSSRTPKCQSSPSEDADTLTAGTVRVKSSEPVECQKATEPPVKSFLNNQYDNRPEDETGMTDDLIRNIVPYSSNP